MSRVEAVMKTSQEALYILSLDRLRVLLHGSAGYTRAWENVKRDVRGSRSCESGRGLGRYLVGYHGAVSCIMRCSACSDRSARFGGSTMHTQR